MTKRRKADLSDLSVIGVDIGKDVFHLVGFDEEGHRPRSGCSARNLRCRPNECPVLLLCRSLPRVTAKCRRRELRSERESGKGS